MICYGRWPHEHRHVEPHFFSDRFVASVIHYDVLPENRMGGAGLRLLMAFRK